MKTKAELIEGKVMATLDPSEEKEFERLISTDQAFANEYQIALHLSIYMKNESLFQFRNKLQNISSEHRGKSKKTKVLVLNRYWKHIASTAAVLFIFLGSYWYFNRISSPEALFERYYHSDEVYLNSRSGNATPTDLLEQGLLLFEKDQYEESINYFEQLPTSITAVYYSGVAHMEIGEYEVAKFKFDQVIENYVNVFYDQAMWYKGLCLLKQGQIKDAKSIFKNIKKSDSYYKNQANEIIDKLK